MTARNRAVGGPPVSAWRAVCETVLLNSLYHAEGQQRAGVIRLLHRLVPSDRSGLAPALQELSDRPFNTNPLLAGLALGPLVSVVHDPATLPEEAEEQARRTVSTLGPAVGALGDRLRFGAFEPAVAGGYLISAWIWPPLALLWYLLGGLAVRCFWSWRAWTIGLQRQPTVLEWLGERILDRWIGSFQRMARVLMGATLGFIAVGVASRGGSALIAFVILLAVGVLLGRRGRISPVVRAWIAVGASLLLGFAIGFEG